jgi:hypothetical protein
MVDGDTATSKVAIVSLYLRSGKHVQYTVPLVPKYEDDEQLTNPEIFTYKDLDDYLDTTTDMGTTLYLPVVHPGGRTAKVYIVFDKIEVIEMWEQNAPN